MTAVAEEEPMTTAHEDVDDQAPRGFRSFYQSVEIDRLTLADIDTSAKPLFTVKEMATFFFARTSHWVRWLENSGQMTYEDPATGETRQVGTRRTGGGARVYTLSDVEEIAHALAQNGAISGIRLIQTLTLIRIQAEMYEYL